MKVSSISKDSENPFFKSKYFDINKLLEIIKPVLNEMNVVILQPLSNVEGRPALRTVLYDTEKGQMLSDTQITLPDLTDPQKMGSAITYYRRYSLQSLLGLEAEDDDGNLASNKTIKEIETPKATTPVTETKKVIPPKTDPKKSKIVKLCKDLGFEGTTAKEYEIYVMGKAMCILKEENYDRIITKLEDLINNK